MPIEDNKLTRDKRRPYGGYCFVLIVASCSFAGRSAYAQCNFVESDKLIATEGPLESGPGDLFGYSVSVSGDVIAVGSVSDDWGGGFDMGSAYLYRLIGGTWVQEAKFTASDGQTGDSYGTSVSVNGNVIVVGAIRADSGTVTDTGAAYVYRFNEGFWVPEAKLTASDKAHKDYFGFSVSVGGDVIVVGAPVKQSAYVYRLVGGKWVQEAELTASDVAAGIEFGWSVSVSGDVVVVGAPWGDSAHVFQYNGSTWVQQATLTVSGVNRFGYSVSVSGERILVGASEEPCPGGPKCGSAYVYRLADSAWGQEQKLTASDQAPNEYFGHSVSLSGDRAIVGVALADSANCANCGAAYVYDFSGSMWIEKAKFTASDAAADDNFASSVSVSGDVAVAGAPNDDFAARADRGSAYVLALDALPLPTDCNANGIADACEIDCNVNQVPDDCDVMGGASDDCNGNLIPDECDPQDDCNNNGSQDVCDVAGGTSLDCNGDEVPDECQLSSNDCNENEIPDDCESSTDCNVNAIPDICDIAAGMSEDCNANAVPDDCDIADETSTDANGNDVPDECDTDLPPFIIEQPADMTTCGPNTEVFNVVAGGMPPFTYQWRKDTIDISGATSDTLTLSSVTEADEGDYDVVVTNDLGVIISDQAAFAFVPGGYVLSDPTGIAKCRFISFSIPEEVRGCELAVRVTLTSLHHVDPPYNGGPSLPFTECEGQVRWVGPPAVYIEGVSYALGGPIRFVASRTQATPYYRNWSSFMSCTDNASPFEYRNHFNYTMPLKLCETDSDCVVGRCRIGTGIPSSSCYTDVDCPADTGTCQDIVQAGETCTVPVDPLVHVTGSEVVPSSIYDVQAFDFSCVGNEETCPAVSGATQLRTTRWGDVDTPYNPPSTTTQPDFVDIAELVRKFEGAPPPKARLLLAGTDDFGTINIVPDAGFPNIAACVNAFKGLPYPYQIQSCP